MRMHNFGRRIRTELDVRFETYYLFFTWASQRLDQRVFFVHAGNLKFQFLSLRGRDIFLVANFRVFRRKTHFFEMVNRKKKY